MAIEIVGVLKKSVDLSMFCLYNDQRVICHIAINQASFTSYINIIIIIMKQWITTKHHY